MAFSLLGLLLAAFGYLTPVGGAIAYEIIDVLAIAILLQSLSNYT